jgi:flagellar hook assembly protein FlgD
VAFAFESFEPEPIKIEIVDVTGRMIRHATLEASASGSRTWTWDGLGDGGERMAAGYYRVRAFGPSGGMSRPFVRLAP